MNTPREGSLTPHEVDDFVREADRLAQVSHAQRNQFLMTRWLDYAEPPRSADGSSDPYGKDYLQWVLAQWSVASGRKTYALELEHDNNVSVSDEQLQRLYPFVSGDTTFISQYMIGVYHALGLLADAPNHRMVEYGVGWGNTTVAMLQAGYQVLAVDIDPKWLNLLKLRAGKLGVADRLQTLHGEFGTLPNAMEPPGGVLFYECFHHALNHDDTLDLITRRLTDGGLVLFAGETIFKEFPQDWGVRLDGHSVWAIRRYGWMELAFSEDYFIRLTRRHHLALQHHQLAGLGTFGLVYKGVLDRQGVALGHTLLSSQETGFLPPEIGGGVHTRFTSGEALLELPCGAPQVSLELKNWLSVPVAVQVRVANGPNWSGTVPAGGVHSITLPNAQAGYFRRARITSDTHVPAELGINGDTRRLGIAVGRVRLHP